MLYYCSLVPRNPIRGKHPCDIRNLNCARCFRLQISPTQILKEIHVTILQLCVAKLTHVWYYIKADTPFVTKRSRCNHPFISYYISNFTKTAVYSTFVASVLRQPIIVTSTFSALIKLILT